MGCCDHQGEESEGNCPPPTLGAGYRRLVPTPRFGLSSGEVWSGVAAKAPAAGCGLLRPVRTQEAAELSSGWWKAHLQAPAKTNSHKTVVVFHHCAVGTGNDFVKIWLVLRLSKILQFFGSGWGLTSAALCTPWLPSCAAGMSRQALQIRANILYVYADQYIAVSAHSEGWRVEPAGICPLPYRQPGTMSREGTKRPLASPCNAFSAMQRGGEARLLHRVTLFHPPRATCSFRWGGAAI